MPSPHQSFSKRHGYSHAKEITVREDAPEELRVAFLKATRETAQEYTQYPEKDIRDAVYEGFGKRPPTNWHHQEAWEQVEHAVYECEWFRVYDSMESVDAYFERTNPKTAKEFAKRLNDLFIEQGIGWQIVNGEVVTRGDEAFENAVKTAVSVLEEDTKPTAAGHLRFALSGLSARPKANTSGAVAHATSAIECVLGEITGGPLTLGKYLDKHPGLFHPALKKGLDGIYGYASDEGARHGKEGTEPSREEAEFVVAACAAICTLLTRKPPK
jgi:hypothetical protein